MSRRLSIGDYFMSHYTKIYNYSCLIRYMCSGTSRPYYYISATSGWASHSKIY